MTIGCQLGIISSYRKPIPPIDGMIAWYDISKLNTVYSVNDITLAQNGDNVVQVKDLSFNDNDAIATSSNIAGILNTDGINSMPAINCSNGNLIFNNPTLFDSITGITVFIVGRTKENNVQHPIYININGQSVLLYTVPGGNGMVYETIGFSARQDSIIQPIGMYDNFVYAVTGAEGEDTELYINDSFNSFYNASYGNGYRTVAKRLFSANGFVGEIQIFNSKLDNIDFINKFNALMLKWEIGRITNMIAWYDISKLKTLYSVKDTTHAQNGDNVVQVKDLSYNDNDAIATDSNIAGVLNTDGINSLSIIDSNMGNLIFNNPTLFDSITGITVFIVGKSLSTNTGHPIRMNSNILVDNIDGGIYESIGFNSLSSKIVNSIGYDNPYLYAITGAEGENTDIYINSKDTPIYTDSYGNGYRTIVKTLFNHVGSVGEIRIYNTKLLNDDFNLIFNELQIKWNIGTNPIDGMIMWYDMSESTYVFTTNDVIAVNGDPIVKIKDKSFHDNDAISPSSVSNKSLLNTNGINSMPIMANDYFGQMLFPSDAQTALNTITGITIFIVGMQTGNNNPGHPFLTSLNTDNRLFVGDIPMVNECIGFSTGQTNIMLGVDYNVPYVYAVTGGENSTTEIYINDADTSIYSATYGNGYRTAPKLLFLYYRGNFAEMQVFNTKLDNADFKNKFNALMTKWGIS